jgi:hypothetical protein
MWLVEDMRTKKEIGRYDNWDDAVLIMDTHFPARIVKDRKVFRFHDQSQGIYPVRRPVLN